MIKLCRSNFCVVNNVLQRTCLRSTYSLRKQLFIAFGLTSMISIIAVMVIVIITVMESGKYVKIQSKRILSDQIIKKSLGSSSNDISLAINKQFETYQSSVAILAETIKDRFAGYPYYYSSDDDSKVPFWDIESKRNKYPLDLPALPLEWTLHNKTNTQKRIVDANAAYFMQGSCDPLEDNVHSPTYYPNCQNANNDYIRGGRIQPTEIHRHIITKAKDLTFIMKPLYEFLDQNEQQPTAEIPQPGKSSSTNDLAVNSNISANLDSAASDVINDDRRNPRKSIQQIGIFFVNDGAGSVMSYPGNTLFGSFPPYYHSIGCDYLNEVNPFDTSSSDYQNRTKLASFLSSLPQSRPFATRQQIQRCHPKGTIVPMREFNPLEREWCRDQILHPDTIRIYGPYKSKNRTASTDSNQNHNSNGDDDVDEYILTFGQSVFDRVTGKLIACTLIDVNIERFQQFIQNDLALSLSSTSASNNSNHRYNQVKSKSTGIANTVLIRNDDVGTIIASSLSNNYERDFYQKNKNKTGTALRKKGLFSNANQQPTLPRQRIGSGLKTIADIQDETGIDSIAYADIQSFIHSNFNNRRKKWDPVDVKNKFIKQFGNTDDNVLELNGYFISINFLPPIPDVYDINYEPSFIEITSMAKTKLNDQLYNTMYAQIDTDVSQIIQQTLIGGCIGFVVIIIFIYLVSSTITKPLVWLNKICKKIVNNAGDINTDEMNNNNIFSFEYNNNRNSYFRRGASRSKLRQSWTKNNEKKNKYTFIRTELNRLEADFAHMLDYFSGDGAAKVAKVKVDEIFNKFRWKDEYQDLYDEDALCEANVDKPNNDGNTDSVTNVTTSFINPISSPTSSPTSSTINDGNNIIKTHLVTEVKERDEAQKKLVEDCIVDTQNNQSIKNRSSQRHPSTLSDSVFSSDSGEEGSNDEDTEIGKNHDGDENLTTGWRQLINKSISNKVNSSSRYIRHSIMPRPTELLSSKSARSLKVGRFYEKTENKFHSDSFLVSSKRKNNAIVIEKGDINSIYNGNIGVSHRVNLGKNVVADYHRKKSTSDHERRDTMIITNRRLVKKSKHIKSVFTSPLFWWVSALIAVPTLITMGAIIIFVITNITSTLPRWIEDVEKVSIIIERDTIVVSTLANALFAQEVMAQASRDLFLYTRVVGGLLFGGLQRSTSFTETITAADECKIYETDLVQSECPFYQNKTLTPCDCEWNDSFNYSCSNFIDESTNQRIDTRYLQKKFFVVQSSDADPVTGERLRSSYPAVGSSPRETMFYDMKSLQSKEATTTGNGERTIPGLHKGNLASGYNTTYDRIRVLSASAVIDFPIYNYKRRSNTAKHLGTFVGFDADGMVSGYAGCEYSYAGSLAHFRSSNSNGAYKISPKLCPLGAYGYDCRCRDWYATGKKQNNLYISTPYLSAGRKNPVFSAAYPLVDPMNDRHVGQALLDFLPDEIVRRLQESDQARVLSAFSFVITPHTDVLGGDTVAGPNYTLKDGPMSINDVVLPHDEDHSENRIYFNDTIVKAMKEAKRGQGYFYRRQEDTHRDKEKLFVSYAPVYVKTLKPLNHTDFDAGCVGSKILAFSLAKAVPDSDIITPFQEVKDLYQSQVIAAEIVLLICIVIAMMVVAFITYTISVAIITPTILLKKVIKRIKNNDIRGGIPELPPGGSLEVTKLYDSFEKLYLVVQFANTAFFEGDIEQSKRSLIQANELFKKLGNLKACGVACNNLGLLSLRMSTVDEGIFIGRRYFDESIRIGTIEIKQAHCTDWEADYTKQLANRYFNRGTFLLMNDEYEAGRNDILASKCLDDKARTLWRLQMDKVSEPKEQKEKCEAVIFKSILSRVDGVLKLMQNHGLDDVLDVQSLIEEANAILSKHWNNPKSKLFRSIRQVGRKQQVNNMRIQYELFLDNVQDAAKIALKMLVEDEYILERIFATAVAVVNLHYNVSTKNIILCLDRSASMSEKNKLERARHKLRLIYDKYCLEEDFVAYVPFNNKIQNSLTFPLQRKEEFQTIHRQKINDELIACGGSNIFMAIDHCVDQINSLDFFNHSWIVMMTDGDAWDSPDCVFSRIRMWNAGNIHQIHLIIIAFDMSNREAKQFRTMLDNLNKESILINLSTGDSLEDKMEGAFQSVCDVICSGGVTIETY